MQTSFNWKIHPLNTSTLICNDTKIPLRITKEMVLYETTEKFVAYYGLDKICVKSSQIEVMQHIETLRDILKFSTGDLNYTIIKK